MYLNEQGLVKCILLGKMYFNEQCLVRSVFEQY